MRKYLTHAIAACKECSWYENDYISAVDQARKHANKTGHVVLIEQNYFYEMRASAQRGRKGRR